ncbi:MAG: 30S ribosomal protein S6 [Prolixibacteraceae bacterium]|jgi:small subunit ribosomal protein S6|nr:30S ribosomal protein S6 [Prolixibacteraceae bacterium]HNQ37472.1 30S ribosomal protein S6 [Prolixibacteraceae bacterium]HPJ78357.1 30S ribosomal protein S6 [Prolixibacteraceae bacterium]HRV88088.1 30S ribosomal protein S6 [Prolixibacteraceae bacterium]
MMNQYETVFIATPVLSEPQVKEAVKKFRDIITDNGGEMIHEEEWGMKKLAYPIQKKSTGFYHLFEFKAAPAFIDKLETEFRRDEKVIRFLTVKLDKYAAEYSQKRRNLLKDKAVKEE